MRSASGRSTEAESAFARRYDAHAKYLAAVNFVEQRFPIGDQRGQINVKFAWKDALKPKNKVRRAPR